MINMKDLIKKQGNIIRKETNMITEATRKWAVKVTDIGTVIVDAKSASEAKKMVGRKLRSGIKDIESIKKALPAKKVSDFDDDNDGKYDIGTW